MANKVCTLQVTVGFDDRRTDPEGLATLLDRIINTTLELTHDEIRADYGKIDISESVVAIGEDGDA